jgi:hypothetical protein
MDSSSSNKRKPWVGKSEATKRSLRREYRKDKYPTEARKEQLASKFNVAVSQINTWFVLERKKRGVTGSRKVPGPLPGPRPKLGGGNGQTSAGSAFSNSHLVQDIAMGADLDVKVEVQDADIQIKTENGFVDVKPSQIGAYVDKIAAKWEQKRAEAHLEVGQAFQKVETLDSKQTMLKKTVTQANQTIAQHRQKILEAEATILEAERTTAKIVEDVERAEAEHIAKKEKLDNIMETLNDLRSQ